MKTLSLDQKAMLADLEILWSMAPQLRLGQLVVNVLGEGKDPYYVSDEDGATRLQEAIHARWEELVRGGTIGTNEVNNMYQTNQEVDYV